jgi:hypothetical protein
MSNIHINQGIFTKFSTMRRAMAPASPLLTPFLNGMCYKTAQIKVDQTKNKNTDFYVENPNGKKPRNARRRITIIGGVLQYTRGQTLYVLSIWRNSLSSIL